MKLTHIAFAIGLALAATGARAERLVIKGSDTLGAKLVPQLAEQFKAQNPAPPLTSPPKAPPRASPPSLMAPRRSACRAVARSPRKSAPPRRKA